MGSNKDNGRGRGPGRRRGSQDRRRQALPNLESLENRRLLTGPGDGVRLWQPTSADIGDIKNGPLANAGDKLIQVYQNYQKYTDAGFSGSFATSKYNTATDIRMAGDYVAIGTYGIGDLPTYANRLRSLGMIIAGADLPSGLVEGIVPIAQLPALAGLSTTAGLRPQNPPRTNSVGAAVNQAETAELADLARTQFNVNGSGITVGALSDSFSNLANGYANSQATGDLPAGVNVLFDNDQGNGADEGRAMLELIHDIAPGSGLAYYNAFSSTGLETVMAAGIRALANAGARVISDDIGFLTEPYYQDGPVGRAITDVTNSQGVVYTSAAGNSADSGYESPFRGVTGTVTGLGAGRYMDFDPGTGQSLTLSVTVGNAGNAGFQFDQPFGVVNGVTVDVDVYLLNPTSGAIVASGTSNNIATNQPFEELVIPTAGTYNLVVQVKPGSADPGRIALYSFAADVAPSQQYGNAGGINYPTTFGHPTTDAAIGTGAVAWFDAPAFPSGQTPTPSEDFSSFGPSVKVFNADGTRKASVEFQQTPVLSGADGSNTSFFGSPPGSAPPNLPANNYTLPNFYGTSAAAPNVAAVAALQLQLSPTSSPADIRAGLIQSTIPLNGTPKGTWDVQGGYGLIQATAALNAVDNLRVTTTSPANLQAFGQAPAYLYVTFSRAVNLQTVQASDLVFTSLPAGVTVTVGTPLVPNPSNPTTIVFPLTYNVPAGARANGGFFYTIAAGSILAADAKPLVAYSGAFGVSDTTAPRVVNTNYVGRTLAVTFSEPLNPASVNKGNVYLIRTGASGVFGNPTNVAINQDPRILLGYDPASNTVIIDYSQIDQSQLPTDNYAIVVLDSVTDALGNPLDGEFNGVFPSGNGVEGGIFTQFLGRLQLQAPQILSLALAPQSDTGIGGDQNTNQTLPFFLGQVSSVFPGAVAGLTVVAQFTGLRGGTLSLSQGLGGRGFTGADSLTLTTTTNAQGQFAFRAPTNLPAGFQTVRVVVVGGADQPPLPGLSTLRDASFRVDTNGAFLAPDASSVQPGSRISALTTIVLDAVDGVLPNDPTSPFSVPIQFTVPALNPATASNISNYALVNLGSDNALGGVGAAADTNLSTFLTSAAFATVGRRTQVTDPFVGTVTLTFAPGLPAGRYLLVAYRPGSAGAPGITDAAGNPIVALGPGNVGLDQDFTLGFDIQPTPAYITSVQAVTQDAAGGTIDPDTTVSPRGAVDLSGPRSYFEVAVPGTTARATNAPTSFAIDVSNPLVAGDYTGKILLIRSSNTATGNSDGDFGADPTFQNGVGYTIVPTTAKVINSVLGASFGTPGFRNRIIVSLPEGTSLPADQYRLYIPNAIRNNGTDLRIFDVFGNQLDGEFLGNPSTNGDGTYENLLGTGAIRANDVSGDGVPGGAFETGYIIVPNGNVIFAKPDINDDPINSNDDPDGSFARPFGGLGPEAVPTPNNGGDLNSGVNFAPFDSRYDLNGDGIFTRSAFVAAAAAALRGPVVIVALPSTTVASKTFVLQAGSGVDPLTGRARDGSATVPANTSLVFTAGTVLKFFNASLFVQNQGSSLQVRGGPNPNQQVVFTSYLDDAVGGDTNGDGIVPPGTPQGPKGGNWGGIVLRNFDDTSNGGRTIPVAPGPVDYLRGKLGTSGADEALTSFNQATVRYAGGSVPQTDGYRYDAITNFNTRPAITNVTISQTGGATSAQAAISGDVDSFREDDLARGILVRRANIFANSINGIYIRSELNGQAEPTDSVAHPDNPASLGGTQNYSFFAPLPYVIVSRLVVGQTLIQGSNGQVQATGNRFYFQPGTVFKAQRGSGIDVVNANASINIGDRTYLRQNDAQSNIAPTDAGFRTPDFGDAPVLFTSFFDDNATTNYRDPNTGALTPIVRPLDSDNGGATNLPVAGNVPDLARWGGLSVISGAKAVIDEATFEFGGASVNIPSGTIGQRDVLAFEGAGGNGRFGLFRGTTAYVTNNTFLDNLQAAISIDPNGLLATDPLRPLVSGNPFFRGNLMQRNQINGMEVRAEVAGNATNDLTALAGRLTYLGYDPNVFVSTVWDDTDLTYVLRGTLRLAGFEQDSAIPLPAFPDVNGGFLPELKPSVVLTIQSSLPDSLLANGQRIPRPGESALVKLLNTRPVLGNGIDGMPSGDPGANDEGGAGFIAGQDNTIDAAPDNLIDPGYLSQIRITGIGGNETTGQQRVPVIITSIRDDTAGKTVRGVDMFQTVTGNTTAPAPGDGGVILFGALGLSDYNLLDPRDGSIIDNADIRYLTRIEQQGGGWVYVASDGSYSDRVGTTVVTQYNTAKAITVSNSNIADFSQVGFLAHPSRSAQLSFYQIPPPNQPAFARGATVVGQPTLSFFYNNTFANIPTAVRINSENANTDATILESPAEGVFLNNTFYNNGEGIHTQAPAFTGMNPLAHVYILTMNNIFANSTDVALRILGMSYNGQGQYNLFSSNNANTDIQGSGSGPDYVERQAIIGSANFRDPQNGLFSLLPNSDAIDSSRSEIGPLLIGNSLQPIVTQQLDASTGIRRATGRTNTRGGLGFAVVSGDIVSLPGYSLRNFKDQWVPAISGSPGAIPGPNTNAGGTYSYVPITGERDQGGFLRIDDPQRANVGFGSRPFFDTGANEYILLQPPHITNVTAIVTPAGGVTTTIPFYSAGNVVGSNRTPNQIVFQFDQRLDPATVNNLTFVLQAANGDGIFDNGNDKLIDLAGKLLYNANLQTVSLALSDSNLSLGTDVYRIEVFGSGGNVVRNPQGLALDGENTAGGQPGGATGPLPSGDNFPGGNFFLTFAIDTNPPSVVAGTFALAAASDTAARDNVTSNNRPSFTGQITDVVPPSDPLTGQRIFIDISTKGDGNYDMIGVAQGTSDRLGNFTANYLPGIPALPDTPYNVGPDGLLGTADDTAFSVARLRVVDQSGNTSSGTDPNSFIRLVIDTTGPRIVGATPISGAQATPTAAGTVAISIAVNENILPSTFNTQTITVTRAGGDGIFGNGNDVTVAIDPASLVIQNLFSPTGSEILKFNVAGATTSDVYRVAFAGDGGTVLTDVAGNALDGDGNGTPGGNAALDFLVFNPVTARVIYVSKTPGVTPDGSRGNTYGTIASAIAVAQPGDTVAVLPGVYTESIALKSLVRVVSAANTSSGGSVVPGIALQTILRAPASSDATVTVSATDLISVAGFETEFSGFTVAAPLVGNSATGPINLGSTGLALSNSDILISKNFFVDAGYGVQATTSGASARTPLFQSNGFIGNYFGLAINDINTASVASGRTTQVANNTFAFNTYGLFEQSSQPGSALPLADVVNNIFWENVARGRGTGAAIVTNGPNRMYVRNNLFSGNGPSENSPADDLINVGAGIDPAGLSGNPDAAGNFVGNPAFVSPIDPRPEGSGPGNFFLGANYGLQVSSAAIDVALNAIAPPTDFLSLYRVDIANRGRAGVGPADIGAFEFSGSASPSTGGGPTGGGSTGGGGVITRSFADGSEDDSIAVTSTSAMASTGSGSIVTTAAIGAPAASTASGTGVKVRLVRKGQAKAAAKAKAAARTKAAHAAQASRGLAAQAAHKPTGPVSLVNRYFRNGR